MHINCRQFVTKMHEIASQFLKNIPGCNTRDPHPGEGDTPSLASSPDSTLRASIRGLWPLDVSIGTSL